VSGRIVGGSLVSIEERPFQLSLEKFGEFLCGASIISREWAVSSATCLDG
jgi:secreted trypsin-like serine protease